MFIKTTEPKVLLRSKCILGEGTLWVKEHNTIYFVDIKKKKIYAFNVKTKKTNITNVNKPIGFLAHIKKYNFILGLQGELRIVDLRLKKIIRSIDVEKKIPNNRINDGKTDPSGRLWFGTMDNFERSINKGSLYCLDKNFKLHKVDKNYIITNGPAFLNKDNFYHTDSRKKIIYKIKIDKNFNILEKKIFINFKSEEGSPDGMTLDRKNNLWVCHFNGACISVFNKKGEKIHRINLPAKNITNCTFGGKNHNELFVSSATKSMSRKDYDKFKNSGSFFSIKTNMKGNVSKSFKVRI